MVGRAVMDRRRILMRSSSPAAMKVRSAADRDIAGFPRATASGSVPSTGKWATMVRAAAAARA